jgi:hypothetical protein
LKYRVFERFAKAIVQEDINGAGLIENRRSNRKSM